MLVLYPAVWVKSRVVVVLSYLETVEPYMSCRVVSVCIFHAAVVTEFKEDIDTVIRTASGSCRDRQPWSLKGHGRISGDCNSKKGIGVIIYGAHTEHGSYRGQRVP